MSEFEKVKYNMTNFEKVGEFMETFGQRVESYPTLSDDKTRILRMSLIEEEVGELKEALDKKDLVEVADALTDILYVVYGTGHALGIELDACFAEVHRSNMSKLGPDGKPIKRGDGKILKGENYTKPDLAKIIKTVKVQRDPDDRSWEYDGYGFKRTKVDFQLLDE